jgi:phosphoribosylformylglycinamidine synthase subunit PurQ / glutaminase
MVPNVRIARSHGAPMKTGIVIFPGINRQRDMAIALERSGAKPRMIWHKETDLSSLVRG